LIGFAHERGATRVEATAAGVAEWTKHVLATGEGLLMNEIDSWMTGVNRNVEGKQTRKIMRYSGGHPAFREHCDAVAADSYRKLALARRNAGVSPACGRDGRGPGDALPAHRNAPISTSISDDAPSTAAGYTDF